MGGGSGLLPEPPLTIARMSLVPPVKGRVTAGVGAVIRTLNDLPSRPPPALRRLLVPGRCRLLPASLPSVYCARGVRGLPCGGGCALDLFRAA